MKALLAAAVVLLAAAAVRAQPPAQQLGVHESKSLRVLGATAAYAVDASIVDASVNGGEVRLFARSAGRTQVVVVSMTGQTTFDVVVAAPAGIAVRPANATASEGRVETRYANAGRQLHNTVDVVRGDAVRRTETHVETVRYGADVGEKTSVTLPSVSYRMLRPGREITLFDRFVDESPLTVSSTTVRGFHYVDDHWRVHLGTTAYAAYQSFLLPAQRDRVAGAAYAIPLGAGRLVPGVFSLSSGTVASLLYEYAAGERLSARAELAVSRGVAAAAQVHLVRERDQLHADLRYRPRDFPIATPGEPRGLFADSSYTATFGRGSTIDAALSRNDFDLPGFRERSMTASTNVRFRATDTLSLLGGGTYGEFGDARTFTIPAGVQLDYARFGASALLRWSESSATNRGGPGFRLGVRASAGRLFASGYADYQQQAATLALIYREEPELALALAQLGLTATSPADIARALRENSTLAALGYIDGLTVELTPVRIQSGLEVAWLGSGPARPQLRARLLFNRNESVASRVDTAIATLSASRRTADGTEIFGSYSWWRTRTSGGDAVVRPLVEVGVRHRFDDVESFLPARGGITGSVFVDEDLDGASDGQGVAGAEVELDGAQRVTSAADGTFAFRGVSRGAHRVVARAPRESDAFFTTPSRVEAQAGDVVRFGVARTPARLFGRVVSDAGDGVGGVSVTLTRGAARLEATSASDGSFSVVAPPGEWTMAIDSASLPAGYSAVSATEEAVTLARDAPASFTATLRANRSVSGRTRPGVAEIAVDPLARRVPVAADGRFTIRSLPAGDVTLRAGTVTQRITLPRGPAVIHDVVLDPRVAGAFAVQLGAFRVRENAVELLERARRSGIAADLVAKERLTFVRSGAYATHERAAVAAQQLARAGFEAIVVSR